MNNDRRGFLKVILGGMAAAPVLAALPSAGKPASKEDQILVKRWTKDGLKFAEWTLPKTTPPHFKKVGDTTPRSYVFPPFNMDEYTTKGGTMEKLVESCLAAHLASSSVTRASNYVDGTVVATVRGGSKVAPITPSHVTIVRVHGMPKVMALAVTGFEVVPKENHYESVGKCANLS